jgi:putative radical SAM enzyme (TIGR03279 family)
MKNKISRVYKGSIAEEVDIKPGDYLIKINEKEVNDILDYKFLSSDENIILEIEKEDGDIWEIPIEKEFGEDLGMEFDEFLLDKAKSCNNKCIFCFIDQLPKGMRKSLYFKDDDSRLSFLQGNFITLTNLSDSDIDRIIEYKISPINVSVHTTNSELRIKMLRSGFAGNILDKIIKLVHGGIKVNCQIVSCLGYNNGEELIRTIKDLYSLYPGVMNLAVVPFGASDHRDNLTKIDLYDEETARQEIENVKILQEKYIKENGTPFVRLSDEFYITGKIDFPDNEFYEDYEQIEDGIGMISYFRENIKDSIDKLKKGSGSFTIVTGKLAYKEMEDLKHEIEKKNPDIKINVVKIINNLFGENITVSGLLTGKDIIEQLKDNEIKDYVILPSNLVRRDSEVKDYKNLMLLDDYHIIEIENSIKRKIILANYNGEDLIEKINNKLRRI